MIRSRLCLGICNALMLMAVSSQAKAALRPNAPTITPATCNHANADRVQLADEATRRLRRLHVQIFDRPEFRPYDDGTVCYLDTVGARQA